MTPPLTPDAAVERAAILAMLKLEFGMHAVHMTLAAGMPVGTKTDRVKAKAFAEGVNHAVASFIAAIESGTHTKDISDGQ